MFQLFCPEIQIAVDFINAMFIFYYIAFTQ